VGLPLPVRLTHKHRPDAQIVERWWRTEIDRFGVVATWGADHPHYRPASDGSPALVLVAETLRQAVIAISHAAYDVPHDHAFVMRALSVELDATVPDAAGMPDVWVDLACHDVVVSDGDLRSMDVSLQFVHDGRTFGRGSGSLCLLPAPIYRRLRGTTAPVEHRTGGRRVPACDVGKVLDQDVLLVGDPGPGLRLGVDTAHRWHFDHPADHLPGMLLVEAAVQSHTLRTADAAPRALHARFDKYAEVTPDVGVHVERSGAGTAVGFRQDGAEVASVVVLPG
jgi:hypothetical protein